MLSQFTGALGAGKNLRRGLLKSEEAIPQNPLVEGRRGRSYNLPE